MASSRYGSNSNRGENYNDGAAYQSITELRRLDQARRRKLLVLQIAIAGTLSLAGGLWWIGNAPQSESEVAKVTVERAAARSRVNVLVPVTEIAAGAPLDPAMFKTEAYTPDSVTSRTITEHSSLVGKYARSAIVPGIPITEDVITSVRPVNAVTSKIPVGYRAVTIAVNATSSVEGWARPGARVDVSWSSKVMNEPAITVIVQNAQVLSAERQAENGGAGQPGAAVPTTATILVSEDDAKKILLATTSGELSLSLRGDNDSGRGTSTRTITASDLLSGRSTDQPVVARAQPVVEVRDRFGKASKFQLTNSGLVPLSNN